MTALDLGDRRKDLLNDRQEHQQKNLKNDVNCQTTRQKILQRIHHFLLNIRSSAYDHCIAINQTQEFQSTKLKPYLSCKL